MKNTILTISIVHFNTPSITIKCIDSLIKVLGESKLAGKYEVSIIDNRSSEANFFSLKEYIDELSVNFIKIQRNCFNAGFGLGCMLTLNNSAGKYVAFVNSDTYFEEDCFSELVDFIESNNYVGAITPQHLDGDGKKVKSYGYFESFYSRFISNKNNVIEDDSEPYVVDFIFGSFMMVRRDDFSKVGGFDPNIFLYYEEMDLCMRLKAEGLKCVVYPQRSFRHIFNASTGVRSEDLRFESLLSMIYVVRKHRGIIYGVCFYFALIIKFLIKSPFKSRNRRLFIRLLTALMPQATSMRLKQKCGFLESR